MEKRRQIKLRDLTLSCCHRLVHVHNSAEVGMSGKARTCTGARIGQAHKKYLVELGPISRREDISILVIDMDSCPIAGGCTVGMAMCHSWSTSKFFSPHTAYKALTRKRFRSSELWIHVNTRSNILHPMTILRAFGASNSGWMKITFRPQR